MNRLVFWHGRSFGAKSRGFLSLNIFKNSAFVFSNIYFNMLNGFSGYSIHDDFYFSLQNMIYTVIIPAAYFFLDQDARLEKSKPENRLPKPEKVPTYNPTVCKKFDFETLTDPAGYLQKNGVPVNKDGSTNNISDYFRYVRDYLLKTFFVEYAKWLLWAILSTIAVTAIAQVGAGGIMNEQGWVNDMRNTAIVNVFSITTAFFLVILFETRHWGIVLILGLYIPSYLTFMPLTVWMNDELTRDDYYKV